MRMRVGANRGIGWNADDHSALRQMQLVVTCLNGPVIKTRRGAANNAHWKRRRLPESEMENELRRLVEAWKRSGPNVRKLFEQEPGLAAFSKRSQIVFYPTDTGRGYLEWSPSDVVEGVSSPKDVARDRFMTLITSPNWEALGGPCLCCKDYFIRMVDRPRVYCSARCGARVSAVVAVKTKRERDHAEKVKAAQSLIEKWKEKKRREDWKVWITSDVRFTNRWLTRAVNRGDLKPPGL
jgi:hypothetical protein